MLVYLAIQSGLGPAAPDVDGRAACACARPGNPLVGLGQVFPGSYTFQSQKKTKMAEGGTVDENHSLSSALSDDNARKYECSICLDILSIPKLLPCSHTFCELCLRKHITAKSFIDPVSASGQSCFECPELSLIHI